ncbi:MAG: hypothetical protein NTZ16_02700 [Verrucomicrobia bacterium]|nr:hypothetical protein [Verrucomicrobiota bacterium]
MKMKNLKSLSVAVLVAVGVSRMVACDFCSVSCVCEAQGAGQGFFTGAAEQFTHFGTMQLDGHKVDNETGQWLDSSIAQVFAGYNFTKRFGVQFNLPIIHREFKRPEGFAMDRGHESGLGDASITGNFVVFEKRSEAVTVRWSVLGGIKLPTGSSSRIAEELNAPAVPGAPEGGIHGHDLTLGSGSVDGIVGSGVFARWKHLLVTASLQYNARTEGDYDYQFANDLSWSVAPGGYLILNENHSLTLQLVVSGEDKGRDTFQGASALDTAMTSVYVGPQLTYTWAERLSTQVGVDLPVLLDNSALQAVSDYRIRAAINWRF